MTDEGELHSLAGIAPIALLLLLLLSFSSQTSPFPPPQKKKLLQHGWRRGFHWEMRSCVLANSVLIADILVHISTSTLLSPPPLIFPFPVLHFLV